MLRRMMQTVLAILLLCGGAAARAEIFLGEPPADWADKALLKWTIFDMNEGDCMLLECGGESMLVDGGPEPQRDLLCAALEERGLKNSMKYILNTHYHHDHIDGIYRLFKNGFTAGEFLHPYNDWAISHNNRGKRTVAAAQKNGVAVRQVGDGDTLTLGEAQIQLYQCTAISDTNARSLVARVVFRDSSILLCADITGKAQHHFVNHLPADALKADIIKLPHHAITPAVPAFLDKVAPEAAVITNRFRALSSKSVTQLEGRGWPALYAGDGTVYAVTDGVDWYLYQTAGIF